MYAHVQGYGSAASSQDPLQYGPTAPQQTGPTQGYPSNVAPSPHYAPPSGAGYGRGYGAPPSQQLLTVVGATQSPVVNVNVDRPAVTYTDAIIYACFVSWCCNIVFGVIAYFLARE